MASGKSQYFERMMLDFAFGGVEPSLPGTLYVALSTAVFNPVTPSAEVSTSGTAYGRAAIARNQVNFPAASSGNPASIALGTPLSYPTATANWGTIASIYVYILASGGEWIYGGDLTSTKAIASGDAAVFNAGQLIFRET